MDHWTAQSADTELTDSGQIYLHGGQRCSIRLECYEGTRNATMQLKWLPPNQDLSCPVIILSGQLLPPLPLLIRLLPAHQAPIP
jgi:hypothetical protein